MSDFVNVKMSSDVGKSFAINNRLSSRDEQRSMIGVRKASVTDKFKSPYENNYPQNEPVPKINYSPSPQLRAHSALHSINNIQKALVINESAKRLMS